MRNLLSILLAINFWSLLALGQVQDETISENKDWMAEKLASDLVWQQSACVASTQGDDGFSTLEVIAFYNPATESFGEPMVHVITPFDVSFFEVRVDTSTSKSGSFSMLPVSLPNATIEGQGYVGARALFDDREDLITALRQKDRVIARYFDVQGEVKSIRFSLRGSSATINSMFAACVLEVGPSLDDIEPLQTLIKKL